MELKDILNITGKSGLFKLVGQMKNGAVVESIPDGKRFPTYAAHGISSLEDITIYCEDDDIRLIEVFERISKKEDGKEVSLDFKGDGAAIRSYFTNIVPEHEADRVYNSDIVKVLKWYNILVDADLLVGLIESENAAEEEVDTDTAKEKGTKGNKKKAKGKE